MKPFSIFILIFFSNPLSGQKDLNKLSVNPIQLFGYNRLNLEFERGFSEGKIGFAIYLGSTGNAMRKIHGKFSNLSEQNVAIKFYPKEIDRSGFWYGGLLSVSSGNIYSEDRADSSTNMGSLGILANAGYQLFFSSIYLNFYTGIGYAITNNLFGSAIIDEYSGKTTKGLLIYGLKIGYKF